MKKTVLLVLGNGFTIDFLQSIVEESNQIDVSNLFRNGDLVPWHNEMGIGYLSHKHCKMLWTLGIRPTLETDDARNYFEQIISCANFFFTNNQESHSENDNLYLEAYLELVRYLKCLFIYYDSLVDFATTETKKKLRNWEWCEIIKSLYQDRDVDRILIVTYNYDIFIERLLSELKIPFFIKPFPTKENKHRSDSKIILYKPHGSISFSYRIQSPDTQFITPSPYPRTIVELKDFSICTEKGRMTTMDTFIAIVPPSGDSLRLNYKWAEQIQTAIQEDVKSLGENTSVIINGLSYWHVDRLEIDKILLNLSPNVRDIVYVDPYPSKVLTAVLGSKFANFKMLRHINKGVIT